MNYLLTQQEFDELNNRPKPSKLEETESVMADLRLKILELAHFKCYHYHKVENFDEGYCDGCPLAFTQNEDKKTKYKMCGQQHKEYSK
jgi:hypothetical protein